MSLEEHENEINEFKKQIEVMEANMRNDKSFVDVSVVEERLFKRIKRIFIISIESIYRI